MKKNQITIKQKDGYVEISRNGEAEQTYDWNRICRMIQEGKQSPISMANWFAEIVCDCLNCRSASNVLLHDLNDTMSYRGSYFEMIDVLED